MLLRSLTALVLLGLTLTLAKPAPAQDTVALVGDVQDKIVISGGVDVVGLSGLDVVAIVPDRMLMDHISDPLVATDKNGNLVPWLVTSWKNIDPLT